MTTIREPAREVPVVADYDVVVVGGGIAGVAAALAAARNGGSVCLLDKEHGLGGLATLANVIVYLPLCDGCGNQVIGGIGEELLKLSVADGFDSIPECWLPGGDPEQRTRQRYRVRFNPMSYLLALEELVVTEGIRLFYDTRFCEVRKTGDLIDHVILETKEGRIAFSCRAVVDASGDADVCVRAGEDLVSLQTNVESAWFYYYDGADIKLVPLCKPFPADPRLSPPGSRGFAGDKVRDVTGHVLDSRAMLRDRLDELRVANPETSISPVLIPSIPSFRMTRRLRATTELQVDDERRYFDDAIGMTGNWRKSGPIYYLPLSSMTGVRTTNLVVAGRCIASAGVAWDITRVIPTCAVTGEAAGTVAAIAARESEGCIPEVAVPILQERLREQGVIIDRQFATSGLA